MRTLGGLAVVWLGTALLISPATAVSLAVDRMGPRTRVLALIGFAFLHVPYWGWGFAIIGLLGGAVATAFFIWKKDLLAMMVFHGCTDAVGLVIAPMFSEWWQEPRF